MMLDIKRQGDVQSAIKRLEKERQSGVVFLCVEMYITQDEINKLAGACRDVASIKLSVYGNDTFQQDCQESIINHFAKTFNDKIISVNLSHFEKNNSYKALSRFSRLVSLAVTFYGKQEIAINQIESLAKLRLKSISFQGCCKNMTDLLSVIQTPELRLWFGRVPDLMWLKNKAIKSVVFDQTKIGAATDLAESGIRFLKIRSEMSLGDLGFLSSAVWLQELILERLPKVTSLPNLEKLIQLKRVVLTNMKQIYDLSPLLTAKVLEDILILEAGHLKPENFLILREHPTLKRGGFGLGSLKRNKEITHMLKLKEIIR